MPSLKQTKRESVNSIVALEDLLRFFQQCVLLVDQTNTAASYHGRLSVLDDVTNNLSQAKSMLKTKSYLLQKEDKDLIGREFRDQITETAKAHKQFKELNFSQKETEVVSSEIENLMKRLQCNQFV